MRLLKDEHGSSRFHLPLAPGQMPTPARASRFILLVAVIATATGACGDDVSLPSAESAAFMQTAASPAASRRADLAADVTGNVAQDAGGASAAAVVPSSMIIRNGSASVLVDSLELAITAVQQMAARFGGYIGNTQLSAGEYQVRSATIEMKIPAARFDSALAGLPPLGVVESVSSTAEDVGEEFVDISARVANAKRLETRLVDLLATRTGKLEDVLAVERELARVREEIERYEGRLRYLQSRVAVSTLTITVHERAPLVSATPGNNIIVDAFKQAWRNFVHFVAGFISWLGVLVPAAALLLALWVGVRRVRAKKAP